MSENRNSKSSGSVIDAFVAGARQGLQIALNATIPNILMAFALIRILNVTGLLDLISNILNPIMGLFGLPGAAGAVLISAFMSMGGGVGAAAALLSTGTITYDAIPILIPAIYLMGSQVQFQGRIGGASELPTKYHIHIIVISVIVAFLSMWVMNLIMLFT